MVSALLLADLRSELACIERELEMREALRADLARIQLLLVQRTHRLRLADASHLPGFAPEPLMAGAGIDTSDSCFAPEAMMSAAGALAPNGPPPDPTDSKYNGDYAHYRRDYKAWHAKEQRRKRPASPLACPRGVVPRIQCASASAPSTATATISRDGGGSDTITATPGTVSFTRDASGAITATATTFALPPLHKGSQPVSPCSSAAATTATPMDASPLAQAKERTPALASASKAAAKRPAIAADLLAISAEREVATRLPCPADGAQMAAFEARFPHEPSLDQQSAFADVAHDMIELARPMHRLVCGDVGFGKTEVAMRAIYRAVCARRQVAFLVPREALAVQHYLSLLVRMPEVRIKLLLSNLKSREKLAIKQAVREGVVDVLIGTSAILTPDVKFAHPGLLVVDEEQLVGVRAKEGFLAKAVSIDVLLLSATPIPRTSALHGASQQGIRSLSNLTTPPAGRLDVQTVVCERDNEQVACAVQTELARSGQILYVVPWVQMVQGEVELLRKLFPGTRIDFAHGDLSDLALRIAAFSRGESDVLVTTTVIECGIDIPRANTIIIQDAVRRSQYSNAIKIMHAKH